MTRVRPKRSDSELTGITARASVPVAMETSRLAAVGETRNSWDRTGSRAWVL